MTKLLTVTLRWMRRDKGRTLLSFISIVVAMYLLTFLGIYFSSFVSLSRANWMYSEGSAHAVIDIKTAEQGEQLTRSSSVSEGAYAITSRGLFYKDYIKKVASGEMTNKLPRIYFNGTALDEINDTAYSASIVSGEVPTLSSAEENSVSGRLPEKDTEIAVHPSIADLYGLKLGGKLTIRYEILSCSPEYTLQISSFEETVDEYGRYSQIIDEDSTCWETADENGEPVFVPDDKGLLDKQFSDNYYPHTDGGELVEYYDTYSINNLLHELIGGVYSYGEYEDGVQREYQLRADIGEPVYSIEKTYDIVGFTDGFELCFSPQDEWAKPMMTGECEEAACYVRIKEGLDIDAELKRLCELAGIPMEEILPDGNVVEHIQQNDDLILLEGRDFSKFSEAALMFGAMIIIVLVFVFFARLIVNNAFELSAAYRLEQYGALKTIGASNRQVFVMVMTECLLYMLTALPVAVVLAFVTGRLIMNGIMDIKIFDMRYGPGVSDKFFTLEIIPAIFISAIAVAVFSVVMSAYACAIRIKRLSPIAAASGKGRRARPRRRAWISKRFFGFPIGYAARSMGRNKMRMAITLLAAVMSGTLVVSVVSMLYGIEKNAVFKPEDAYDVEVMVTDVNSVDSNPNISNEYQRLLDTGLFTLVEPEIYAGSTFGKPDGGVTDSLRASLTEEYQELYSRREALLDALIFQIFPVSRSQFEKLLDSDMSYDELLSSGGVLLCDTVWEDAKSTDLKAFREGITSVAVPVVSENGYTDRNVPVAGRYTSSDVRFVCSERSVKAIVPIENAGALFDELDLGFNTDPPGIQFGMNIREEDIAEVAEYLQNNYHDYQYWINIGETITAKRTLQALRIAGIALAAVIFTAALVNLVSTTAANAVNRRKELSMLRACGMSLRQIAVSLLFECVLFAAVTAAVSSLLGRKLADFLFMLISDTLIPALPWYAPALIGGAVLVLMLGSYLLPLRFAARQPISQEIRAKE